MSTVARRKKNGKKKGKGRQKETAKLPPRLRGGKVLLALQATNGSAQKAYEQWGNYLRDRQIPVRIGKLLPGSDRDQLLWCLTKAQYRVLLFHDWPRGGSTKLTARRHDGVASDVSAWVASMEQTAVDVEFALNAVDCARRLPELTECIPPQQWNQLLTGLIRLARESCIGGCMENPWISQLLVGELPQTLAYLFPEIPQCKELGPSACEHLEASISDLCDGQGMPSVADLGWMPQLAACWTRCLAISRASTDGCLSQDAEDEYDWFVRNLLRLLRRDGGLPFQDKPADKKASESLADMLQASISLTKDKEDKALAKVVFKNADVADSSLPEDPGYHSEWSQLAVLQPEWSPLQPRLTVDFSVVDNPCELCVGGERLFTTRLYPLILVDGRRLEACDDEWQSICWFSDFDVDYLELEMELSHGWKLQRQFLMARQDYFLYFADNLVGPEAGLIDYRLTIPATGDTKWMSLPESREGFLRGSKKRLALILPLALPEWRADPRLGEMHLRDNAIELHQQRQGSGMCAALFLDFHPRRLRKAVTWRQLTVAEQLQPVPVDRAVAFRIHVGPEQWLAYRSLDRPGNRTVLGQNFASEFNLARFLSDGDIESLVEIE